MKYWPKWVSNRHKWSNIILGRVQNIHRQNTHGVIVAFCHGSKRKIVILAKMWLFLFKILKKFHFFKVNIFLFSAPGTPAGEPGIHGAPCLPGLPVPLGPAGEQVPFLRKL